MANKTIIIAWRFKNAKIIELGAHKIIAFKTPERGLIPEVDFRALQEIIEPISEHLYLFIHTPNFIEKNNGKKLFEILKKKDNKHSSSYVVNFHGGDEPVYREFINEKESELLTITNDDVEKKLNACIFDRHLEALFYLRKTLSLALLEKDKFNLSTVRYAPNYKLAFEILNQEHDFQQYGEDLSADTIKVILERILKIIYERVSRK